MQELKQNPATVTASPNKASDFGFNPRPRRRSRVMPVDSRSLDELVAEFLAKGDNKITRCETRYADGAVKSSGIYEF